MKHNYDIGNIIVGHLDQYLVPARAGDILYIILKIFSTKFISAVSL